MIKQSEYPYWITMAHLPKWGSEKINRLIIKIVHDQKMDMETFFSLREEEWKSKFELSGEDISDLKKGKDQLPNNSFLAEDLLAQGFDIIPVHSSEYAKILKDHLKIKSPPILYIKGNKQLLHEQSTAIVGSREADEVSLKFTDNIARLACEKRNVVVSGFAKGVDKQALDSTVKYKGQSIIVLPQGIMTFGAGIKEYYKEIIQGNVLVLSVFHPKLTWSSGLAIARNSIIYGLSNDIFVAQSGYEGGTFTGVLNGLKRERTIYIRMPEKSEKNANLSLIAKGATPVDFDGNVLDIIVPDEEAIILENIQQKALTINQILEITKINWTEEDLLAFLKKSDKVEILKIKNILTFRIKNQDSASLF